jgi:hypothetical protein
MNSRQPDASQTANISADPAHSIQFGDEFAGQEPRCARTASKVTMKLPRKAKGPEDCPGLRETGFQSG